MGIPIGHAAIYAQIFPSEAKRWDYLDFFNRLGRISGPAKDGLMIFYSYNFKKTPW
jgi:hypothetical protein